jgi:hypothetical protein
MIEVILVSGHLVDGPDRPVPRFPQWRAPWVANRVRKVFDEWRVGPTGTVVTGGARGADITAAEEGLARGAGVVLCLAQPPERFVHESVELAGTDWEQRFRRLIAVADVRQLKDPPEGGPVYVRTNAWMIDVARTMDPDPHAVFVWDGRAGDGEGGTADMVRRLGYAREDPRVRIIDPTPGPAR